MKLELYKSVWGMTEKTIGEQCARIREAGYDGVEAPVPDDRTARAELARQAAANGLSYIAQIQVQGPSVLSDFEKKAQWAAEMGAVWLNSHTGRDTLPFEEQIRLFSEILKIEENVPLPVSHETHRSRPTFTPWTSKALLDRFEHLTLTADFSHFCCVCESYLEDQSETMAYLCRRSGLVHARVGFPGGPQVPDPRAPEYEKALTVHENWWSLIAKAHAERGEPVFRATIEYGPFPYMHHLPYTDAPIIDLWSLCLWGKERFKQFFDTLTL